MTRYLIRRLLSALVIIVVISVITFLIFFALPTNPALLACGKTCSPGRIVEIKRALGLDRSLTTQYWEYMKGIFVGRDFGDVGTQIHCNVPCLGISFKDDTPVWTTLMQRLPVTLSLALGAAVIFLVLGVGLGVLAAVRRGKLTDKVAVGFSLVGASTQVYFVGLLLLFFFVDKWQILPTSSYTSPFSNPGAWIQGMILPWAALVILYLALYTRLTRSSMLEVFSEDFIRTARAKGLSQRKVIFKHALRAGITPIVTIFAMDFGQLIGGAAVITETVFGLQGVGQLSVQSVQDSDLPVIMSTTLFAGVALVLANVVVDLLYALIDPRVRLS